MKLGKSGTERSRERCWREKQCGREQESRITGLIGETVEQRGLTCRFPADCMTVSPNIWGHRRRNHFD